MPCSLNAILHEWLNDAVAVSNLYSAKLLVCEDANYLERGVKTLASLL